MDRYVTITDRITGTTATCSVYDIAATLRPWYPDRTFDTEMAIRQLQDEMVSNRHPQAAGVSAYLNVDWDWHHPLDIEAAADYLGLAVSHVRRLRAAGRFAAPDLTLGQSPGWFAPTLDAWQASRPGRGAGGGRPRKVQS